MWGEADLMSVPPTDTHTAQKIENLFLHLASFTVILNYNDGISLLEQILKKNLNFFKLKNNDEIIFVDMKKKMLTLCKAIFYFPVPSLT